jgi:hypothetical protein
MKIEKYIRIGLAIFALSLLMNGYTIYVTWNNASAVRDTIKTELGKLKPTDTKDYRMKKIKNGK